MLFGDGHICHMKGISTIRINLSHRMVRELKDVRYVPSVEKECDFD